MTRLRNFKVGKWSVICILVLIVGSFISSLLFLSSVAEIGFPAKTGRLVIAKPLLLSTTNPKPGEEVIAYLTVVNPENAPVFVEQLHVGARLGSDWNGTHADFNGRNQLVIQPGELLTVIESRVFESPGKYFAEPVLKINGKWGGLPDSDGNFSRIYFQVQDTILSEKCDYKNSYKGSSEQENTTDFSWNWLLLPLSTSLLLNLVLVTRKKRTLSIFINRIKRIRKRPGLTSRAGDVGLPQAQSDLSIKYIILDKEKSRETERE